MEILPITRERLSQMQQILSAAAGYSVSLKDELEYFDPAASAEWRLMQNPEGQAVAFIRHFKQNAEWGLGVLYVQSTSRDRKSIAICLLKEFQAAARFPGGYRLRFDIYSNDLELNEALKSEGFSERTQTFRHYEWTPNMACRPREDEPISALDAKDVAEVLSNLHPVSESEARHWIESQTIRVVRDASKIVAAAQIYSSDDLLEVNRFATHAHFLRRGIARNLMDRIFAEAAALEKKRVYLKVEDTRAPAIAFYQNVGFIEDPAKCQSWHSRWY